MTNQLLVPPIFLNPSPPFPLLRLKGSKYVAECVHLCDLQRPFAVTQPGVINSLLSQPTSQRSQKYLFASVTT